MERSLKEKSHYLDFFLQGFGTAVNFTDEGFRITTPGMASYRAPEYTPRPGLDMTRMYLWYRLDYVQEGERLRGAIDGVTVMDVIDDGFSNNGPVLLNGRIALRCMMRTDMTFRDLAVWNRPHFKTVLS